ncbi:MAG: hypothetical protein DWQ34_24600 [Planctomycetota bacterium]|nr:MAG: hypothetical protein DWQ34_24600 [Planctomycetota bacterium]
MTTAFQVVDSIGLWSQSRNHQDTFLTCLWIPDGDLCESLVSLALECSTYFNRLADRVCQRGEIPSILDLLQAVVATVVK